VAERSVPDIARETLKLLASRRLPPTPENYQLVYEEVAGHLPKAPFPHKALRQIFGVLPTQSAVQKRIALHFNQAINDQNWHGIQQAILAYAHMDEVKNALQPAGEAQTPAMPQMLDVLPPELAEQLARVLDHILPMLAEEADQRMHDLTDQLVNFLRVSPPPLQDLLHMLQNYAYRLSFATEDQAQRRMAIQGMLQTAVTHTAELNQQDATIQTQSRQLLAAMQKPWTLRHLDQLQQQLQTLLLRELDLHDKALEVQEHIKALLSETLQRLAALSENSSSHSSHIEQCASKLEQAQGLAGMASVLEELVGSARAMASENRIAHAALQDLRERSEEEQRSIEALQKALDSAEELARHDPLTQALNAKGLEEALERELARTQRHHGPLSLASIALEGLQALAVEQSMGAVEQAQRHLAVVARSVLRPQDQLARDQPNHFFLLLPSTTVEDARLALERLQQELNQRPLLCEDEKISLQFSAGVVQAWPMESRLDLLNRADQNLQDARMAGGSRMAQH
jgi:diguanylate cyclase